MLYDFIPFWGFVLRRKNKYCNIIYFHDIVEKDGYSLMKMPVEKFKRMMLYLKKHNFETLRFDDFSNPENLRFKKKRVLIAFDDGWLSNYTMIFDWMKEQGIKYNIYLTMGEIGKNPDYLTWDMVREMHSSGLCGFGAHTYTHPDMSDLSKIDYELEINKANELFEQQLGYKPLDFCYPFGYYSEESNEKLSSDTIYERIYTSTNMYSYKQNGAIIFARCGIGDQYPFKYFVRQAKGYLNVSEKYWKVYSKLRGSRV